MWEKLKHYYYQKKLNDERFRYLFDEPPPLEWVSLDTETTGLNTKTAEIVSIGAVKIVENRIIASEKFDILVKPKGKIDENAIKIHHLRYCDVANGLEPYEALTKLLEFIGSRPLVGYYLEFDVALLNRLVKEMLGIRLPHKLIEVSGLYFDHKIGLIPQGNIDLKFDTIINDLKLPTLGKHDALNDAIMTALIFIKLKEIK